MEKYQQWQLAGCLPYKRAAGEIGCYFWGFGGRRLFAPVTPVIVIDFFNWTHMGDWKFDPKAWPDPQAMTRELEALGVKVVVSVWPRRSAAQRRR